MMKSAIIWHLKAITLVIESLKSNRFWVYFVPGLILVIPFLLFTNLFGFLFDVGSAENATNWFTRNAISGWTKIGSALDYMLTQLFIFSVITLLSPFNTLLSEKLDCYLTNQVFTFSLKRFFNDLLRMLVIVSIALILELSFHFIWWSISKIIGFNGTGFYGIIGLIISSYFYGFSFYDHSLERYNVSVKQSVNFAFKNIPIVLITGIIFKILYNFPYIWDTPIIGIIIAPVLTTLLSTVVYLYYKGILNPDTSKLNSNE